jgi:hypothetical protein
MPVVIPAPRTARESTYLNNSAAPNLHPLHTAEELPFGIGYGVGTCINHAPRLIGKKKISDYIGDWLFRRSWPKTTSGGLIFGPLGSGEQVLY